MRSAASRGSMLRPMTDRNRESWLCSPRTALLLGALSFCFVLPSCGGGGEAGGGDPSSTSSGDGTTAPATPADTEPTNTDPTALEPAATTPDAGTPDATTPDTGAEPDAQPETPAGGAETAPDEQPGDEPEVVIEVLDPGLENGNVLEETEVGMIEYTGYLLSGKQFDSSREEGRKPFEVAMPQPNVIEGWIRGIKGMRVGEKRKLTIPPELAYGERGRGNIPPNATLIFYVELVGVQPYIPPQQRPQLPGLDR